ncbi:MAG: hypothetical protein A2W91_01750 [Bacteroidetes bacterium GWF2_38_335]|nr:MAG: hypothetical protein A2W91_01750 [Bacteroidetes bacterium GWF2_38_335]OFY78793.1 MAG: hypothetical protein A2281_19325 [Bacteroidetes bacterium RIFOXYA12_FULL_38_20]HBS85188.1 hypothetical protein [Bacteroidales bacterium]
MEINYSPQPLGRLLSIVGKSFLAELNHNLSHLDIERNYYALILIGEGKGRLTQQELAGKLMSDKVTMVRVIDYLSEKGYVKRVRMTDDHRKYGLVLTPKAEKELPEIKKAMKKVVSKALAGISEDRISEFLATLNDIKRNLNKQTVKL